MSTDDDIGEEEAVRLLKRFLDSACDDRSPKRVKVQYEGQRFFGSYYIDPEFLRTAVE